ncbi:MAG: hypothetical protein WCI00_03390 [bacterium]
MAVSDVFPQENILAKAFVIPPHVNKVPNHSPFRAFAQNISAVGMPNRARFVQSYIPFPSFLSLLNIILYALLIIFHHKKITPPVTARLPTPHQNCFCFGFILVWSIRYLLTPFIHHFSNASLVLLY